MLAGGATGLGATDGVTTRGPAGGAGLVDGGAGAAAGGFAMVGGASGFAAGGVGLATGAGGCAGAAPCCLPIIAFSTSPGLEICERSILVLMPSGSVRPLRAGCLAEPWPSLVAPKCARTFSASCSSMELECVFFSVTPTACNASRIALLLTSSSLARSLIRILLIRLLFPPHRPAKSS